LPLVLVRGAVLVLLLVTGAASARAEDESETRAELAEITETLNDLDSWFGGTDRKRAALEREIAEHDDKVADASAAVAAAAAKAAVLRDEIAQLERDAVPLREARARAARLVADHLQSAYRLAGEDFFRLLMNDESVDRLERMARYHRYFSAAQVDALERYNKALAALAVQEETLEQRVTEATASEAEHARRIAALEDLRGENTDLLARVKEEQKDRAQERDRLEADRQRLESLLAAISRKALGLDGRSFAQSRGRLPWPVDGKVTHAFGSPRAGGRLRWNGIVVGAPDGAEFRAVQSGRVVFADWLRGFGLLTIVDHGNSFMTLYGQAEILTRAVGDSVAPGDVLGRVGRSGGSREAGVYFEIRERGQARDPSNWLTRR
jgi:septal ring factor EnvC (AmiA/AmiB activator)